MLAHSIEVLEIRIVLKTKINEKSGKEFNVLFEKNFDRWFIHI
jgi:hypothetical protein